MSKRLLYGQTWDEVEDGETVGNHGHTLHLNPTLRECATREYESFMRAARCGEPPKRSVKFVVEVDEETYLQVAQSPRESFWVFGMLLPSKYKFVSE